ncbi:MAG: CHAT domain-containing tetratricopeptide repeat protein [Acidimicrobiia bacterium]|nr:CHAT domain-containing tetratricopeptide repeat protein [Acidimicrobiia bacterium]
MIRLLLAAGKAHRTLLQPKEALIVLRQAGDRAQRTGDVDADQGWAVRSELAACHIDLGHPDAALRELATDIDGATEPPATVRAETKGRVFHILGLAHQRSGMSEPAIESYERALDIYRSVDNQLGLGHVYTNLAIIATHAGQVDDAVTLLDQAESAFAAADNELWMAITVLNRGWVVGCSGNLPRSLQLFGRAEDLLTKLDLPDGLRGMSRAEVLLRAGLFKAAGDELSQAIEEFDRNGLAAEKTQAMLLAARAAELAGDIGRASELAEAVIDEMDLQARPGWVAAARATAFGIRCRAGVAGPDVVREGAELVNEVSSVGQNRLVPMIHLGVAWALLGSGRVKAAALAVEQSRHGQQTPDSMSLRVLAEARLLEMTSDLDGALRVLETGYISLESELAVLGGIDVAALAAESVMKIIDTGKRLLASTGRSSDFLRWTDRARQTATWRWPRLESPEIARLLNQVRALTSEAGSEPSAKNLDALERVQNQIRELRWQQESHATVPAPTVDVGSSGRHRVGIDLTNADNRWYVGWRVGEAVRMDDGRPSIGHELAHLDPKMLTAAVRLGRIFHTSSPTIQLQLIDQLEAAVKPLDQAISPYLPPDPDTPVTVSIDPELADIPWPLLPSLRARSFSILPTHRYLTDSRERLSTNPEPCFVVGPGLATRAAELSAYGKTELSDHEQLAAALDHRIVHIAAHGGPEPDNPLFNWLELGFGRVFLHDLMFLDSVPEVIVLAACYAGHTQRVGSGGTASFASGFLGVGSRWVVSASTALTDDDALVEFAAAVLERIVEGDSPPMALARARRSSGDPRSNSASISFTCFGA